MLAADTFERLVAEAVNALPEWVREQMDNVEITIAPWPSPDQLRAANVRRGGMLLGLYEGVPLTKRGRGDTLAPPDRITLFQRPLELHAGSSASLAPLIQQTIIHEIAHHFGISDEKLDQLGY